MVASTLSLQVPFHDQPHPVGLAHFFDLTWLSDPQKLSAYRGVLYLLLLVYASGWFLPIVLPLLAVGYSLMFTLYNSGLYASRLSDHQSDPARPGSHRRLLLHSEGSSFATAGRVAQLRLLVQSQVVVTGTYLCHSNEALRDRRDVVLKCQLHCARYDQNTAAALFQQVQSGGSGRPTGGDLVAGASLDGEGTFRERSSPRGNCLFALASRRLRLGYWGGSYSNASERVDAHGA